MIPLPIQKSKVLVLIIIVTTIMNVTMITTKTRMTKFLAKLISISI